MIKRQIFSKIGWRWLMAAVFLGIFYFGINAAGVAAITYAVPYAANSSKPLAAGTIVVTEKDGSVRPARQGESQDVLGVVAALPEGTLESNKVGVASSGVVSVLVSDIGGSIHRGDQITLSPIEGTGMKTSASGWIIGTAQADFDTAPNVVKQEVVKQDGTKAQVSIRAIPLLMSVSYYAGQQSDAALGPVQHIVDAVAGHPVPAERAILAVSIFALAMILLVTLVASAVKHSLIAIGRNPMANAKITRNLTHVLATAFGVIVVTLVIIYFVLQ